MKIKLIFLLFGLSLISQISYSQIKGKLGKYGINKLQENLYQNGTIEGIVQNINGKLTIKDCLKCDDSPGPILMIYNNWVQIGGKYNKIIDYFKGGSVTEPFLSIEIFKDNTRELVQEIYYTKNNKRTSPVNFWNSSVDYNNSVNEKFDGNFQEIINNEITKVRNSIVGYNSFVKENNSNSQNSRVVSKNKSTTNKQKKISPPEGLSTHDLGKWMDSDEGQIYLQQSGILNGLGSELLNQATSSSSVKNSSSTNNNSSECNKTFKFRIWKGGQYSSGNYWGGWADEETSKPGFVKCPSCNGYGVNWDYDNNEGRPRSKKCYNNSCNGGWVPCNH